MKKLSSKQSEKRIENITGLMMIAIPLIGFIVLNVYPILWTFRWSFFSYNGIDSLTRFIGLENFKNVFLDTNYWGKWINTLQFLICKLPLEYVLALSAAVLLNKNIKFRGTYRALYYLPAIISPVVTGVIFTSLFTYDGFINAFLVNIKAIKEPIDWFANKWTAMGMLTVSGIWKGFGINVLYFVAALSNVPQDVYESAELDGAGSFTTFFKITLPMIAPVFSIVLMLSLLANLGTNESVITLTNGAPAGQTATVMSYLTTRFVPGFTESSTPPLGYGCSLSLITTIIFGIFAIAYDKFNKKMNSLY